MVQLVERRIIHAGEREYELVPNWGELPEGWRWGQCAGVAVDSEDNVHVYTRTEHPYMVFDKNGKFIDAWGENDFGMAHSLCINPDDSVYVLSHKDHWIRKFDKSRKPLMELGKKGQASDTSYTKDSARLASPWLSGAGMPTYNGVGKSAGPFNEPTASSQQPTTASSSCPTATRMPASTSSAPTAAGQVVGRAGQRPGPRNTKNKPDHFHTPHGIGVHGDRVFLLRSRTQPHPGLHAGRRLHRHLDDDGTPDRHATSARTASSTSRSSRTTSAFATCKATRSAVSAASAATSPASSGGRTRSGLTPRRTCTSARSWKASGSRSSPGASKANARCAPGRSTPDEENFVWSREPERSGCAQTGCPHRSTTYRP